MGFTNDQAKAALELSKNNLVINYFLIILMQLLLDH